jgi:hypothetical protein
MGTEIVRFPCTPSPFIVEGTDDVENERACLLLQQLLLVV